MRTSTSPNRSSLKRNVLCSVLKRVAKVEKYWIGRFSIWVCLMFAWMQQHSVVRACRSIFFDTRRRCCVILSLDAFCNNCKLNRNRLSKRFDGRAVYNPSIGRPFDGYRDLLPSERRRGRRGSRGIDQWSNTHCSTKDRGGEFAWIEHGDHFSNDVIVLCIGHIRFETDIGKLRLRSNMNGEIMTIR